MKQWKYRNSNPATKKMLKVNNRNTRTYGKYFINNKNNTAMESFCHGIVREPRNRFQQVITCSNSTTDTLK